MARKTDVGIQVHPESMKDVDLAKATIMTGGKPSEIAEGHGTPFNKEQQPVMRPLKRPGRARKGLTF